MNVISSLLTHVYMLSEFVNFVVFLFRLELNLELPSNPTTLQSTTNEQVHTYTHITHAYS